MKHAFFLRYRSIIICIFYVIFLIFSIYNIYDANNLSTKLFYAALTFVLLAVSLYSEYLRKLYNRAIQTLTFDVDPKKANKQMLDLLHKDYFKDYTNSKIIFDTLYDTDMYQITEGLERLEKHEKFFHSSLDQLYIYHYTKFYLNFILDNTEKVKQEYSFLLRLKGAKVKGNKVSPLYNWEFIDAIYLFSKKNYKESAHMFDKINMKYMNPRERMHVYYQYGQLNCILKKYNKAIECYNNCIEYAGSSKIKEIATKARGKLL